MYRVYFTFRNELGEMRRTYLDNNGEGFRQMDALDVAREMQMREHRDVIIVRIGSVADKQEMETVKAKTCRR